MDNEPSVWRGFVYAAGYIAFVLALYLASIWLWTNGLGKLTNKWF